MSARYDKNVGVNPGNTLAIGRENGDLPFGVQIANRFREK
jgi:hypothetical protein